MSKQRYVTEMGMGVDVHGRDYTNAACRAVSDAIRHSSLNFFTALDKSPHDMKIVVKIGSPNPGAVDVSAVAAELPYGSIKVEVEPGGLEVANDTGGDAIVMINAAVLVYFEEA